MPNDVSAEVNATVEGMAADFIVNIDGYPSVAEVLHPFRMDAPRRDQDFTMRSCTHPSPALYDDDDDAKSFGCSDRDCGLIGVYWNPGASLKNTPPLFGFRETSALSGPTHGVGTCNSHVWIKILLSTGNEPVRKRVLNSPHRRGMHCIVYAAVRRPNVINICFAIPLQGGLNRSDGSCTECNYQGMVLARDSHAWGVGMEHSAAGRLRPSHIQKWCILGRF